MVSRHTLTVAVATILLLTLLELTEARNVTLKIGCPGSVTGAYASTWIQQRNAWNLWLQLVRQSGGVRVGSDRYFFELVVIDGASNPAKTAAATRQLMSQVDIMFAPYSSPLTNATVATCANSMITISGNCGSDTVFADQNGRRRYRYLIGLAPPSRIYYDPFIELIARKGAKTVAIIQENSEFSIAASQGATDIATALKMKVYDVITVPLVTTVTPEVKAGLRAALQQVMALNPDVLLSSVYMATCKALVQLAKELNYMPKAWFLTLCIGLSEFTDGPGGMGMDAAFLYGGAVWDQRLKGADFSESPQSPANYFMKTSPTDVEPPMKFYNAMKQAYGIEPTYSAASAMAMCYALQIALVQHGFPDAVTLQTGLDRLWDSSFNGRLAVNHAGQDDQRPMVLYQYQPISDTAVQAFILAPFSAAQANLVYPVPTWTERVYVQRFLGTLEEQVMVGICGVCILISIFMSIIFVWYRTSKVIRSASPVFCQLMFLGAALMYAAVIVSPLDHNDYTCIAYPWLGGVGIILFVGSLCVKNYRIWKLFTNKSLKKLVITNQQLLIRVGALLCVMLIILAVWMIVDRPVPQMVTPDPYRPALNFHACGGYQSSFSNWPFILIGVYVGALFIAGTTFAVLGRNAPSEFNEAKSAGAAIYVGFFAAILLVVLAVSPIGQQASYRVLWYCLRGAAALLCISGALWLVFVPKLVELSNELRTKSQGNPSASMRSVEFQGGSYRSMKGSARSVRGSAASVPDVDQA